MPSRKKSDSVRMISPRVFRRALAKLTPPSDFRDPQISSTLKAIERVISREGGSPSRIKALLDKLTAQPAPMYTRGGSFGSTFRFSPISVLASIWSGLYLPTGTVDPLVPPSRRYVGSQVIGTASASAGTGRISCTGIVDVTKPVVSAWGRVSSSIFTSPASYGKISRVTLDPDVDWSAHGVLNIGWPFGRDVAGSVEIWGRVWFVVDRLNVATSLFERVAALPHNSFFHSASGSATFPILDTGAFPSGSVPYSFYVDPAWTYLLSVWGECSVSQNFKPASAGSSLPPVTPDQLNVSASFGINVPDMWITHQVLA